MTNMYLNCLQVCTQQCSLRCILCIAYNWHNPHIGSKSYNGYTGCLRDSNNTCSHTKCIEWESCSYRIHSYPASCIDSQLSSWYTLWRIGYNLFRLSKVDSLEWCCCNLGSLFLWRSCLGSILLSILCRLKCLCIPSNLK